MTFQVKHRSSRRIKPMKKEKPFTNHHHNRWIKCKAVNRTVPAYKMKRKQITPTTTVEKKRPIHRDRDKVWEGENELNWIEFENGSDGVSSCVDSIEINWLKIGSTHWKTSWYVLFLSQYVQCVTVLFSIFCFFHTLNKKNIYCRYGFCCLFQFRSSFHL